MAKPALTLRRRRQVSRHKALEYRAARVEVHEDMADWFLGPCPEEHERQRIWDYQDRDVPQYVDEVTAAVDRLLPDVLTLAQRAELPPSLQPMRGRGPANASPGALPAPDEPPMEGGALERHALRWAQALLARPGAMCDAIGRDSDELAAVRVLASRHRGGAASFFNPDDPFEPGSWQRAITIALLAYPMWVRPLSTWAGDTPRSLVEHLLLDYAVPEVLHEWLQRTPLRFDPGEAGTEKLMPLIWFVARSAGCSIHRLFKALAQPGLAEFELSAAEINALERIDTLGGDHPEVAHGAVRAHAEVLRLGGSDRDWQRLRRVWLYAGYPHPGPDFDRNLAHLRSTIQWLVRHGDELGDDDALDVLEWSSAMFDVDDFGQPPEWGEPAPARGAFNWAGRTVRSVLAAAEAHHLARSRARAGAELAWAGRGWDQDFADDDEPGLVWQVRELLSTEALIREGAAQRHCVAAYASACHDGRSAIFQLSAGGLRRLTVEVDPVDRMVVQVRGRFNSDADARAAAIVQRWAAGHGLGLASDVL
jgi:hypothetical protein